MVGRKLEEFGCQKDVAECGQAKLGERNLLAQVYAAP